MYVTERDARYRRSLRDGVSIPSYLPPHSLPSGEGGERLLARP